MGEILPDTQPPEYEPEIEQLADWLIRYESSKGKKQAELPFIPKNTSENLSDVPEMYFERRTEAKDVPQDSPAPDRLQPMVPLSSVLQAYQPVAPIPQVQAGTTGQQKLRNHSFGQWFAIAAYRKAVAVGFVGGLSVILAVVVASILR